MHRSVIDLLSCPVCRYALRLDRDEEDGPHVVSGWLRCLEGHEYAIQRGVVDFGSSPQKHVNTWAEEMTQDSYDRMLQETMERIPEDYLHELTLSVQGLLDEVAAERPTSIVDVGTGPGYFAKEAASKSRREPGAFICVDLSRSILACDRVAILSINPEFPITCLAANAASLPLKSDSVSMVTSFGGMANLDPDVALPVLTELHRVIELGGFLVDNSLQYEAGSPSDEAARGFWRDKRGPDFEHSYMTWEGREAIYAASPFGAAQSTVIHTAIATDRPGDLVPVEGDSYSIVILKAQKR